MKRGFTIIELLVTIVITSVLFTMLATAFVSYDEINKQSIANKKFLSTQVKLEKIMDEDDRLMSTVISPDGVLRLNGVSTSDFIYYNTVQLNGDMSNDYNDYLLVREDDEDLKNAQLEFFDISEEDASIRGTSRYLLLITSKEGVASNGFKFPYKILTLVDLGNVFYRGWKAAMRGDGTTKTMAKNFLRTILKPVNHGYIKNIVIDRESPVIIDIIKQITRQRDEQNAFEVWDSNKYDIKVINISTYDQVKEKVENSIDNMDKIVKNIEDWALIQARIAAYNTLNGDNLDKDYFITCSDDDSCDTGDIVVDKSRTLLPETTDSVIDLEKTTNSGFVVCQASSDGSSCTGVKSYVINDGCVDDVSYQEEDIFEVIKALPIDKAGNDGSPNFKLGESVMKSLLSITKKADNDFGFPIYFTNSDEFIVENISDFYVSSGVDEYKEELNIPVKNQPSNPPYVAKLFTVFPFYIGGHYVDDGTGNKVLKFNDGWGVYSITIFAHIF